MWWQGMTREQSDSMHRINAAVILVGRDDRTPSEILGNTVYDGGQHTEFQAIILEWARAMSPNPVEFLLGIAIGLRLADPVTGLM